MALRNTLVYTVLSVSITEIIALVLAVLLNQKLRGMSVYRTLYFIPVVTMPVAIGLVWRWLYNSDYGIINYLLGLLGIQGANWLSDPDLALYAIVVVGVWSGLGYALVLFLAGLQTIPAEYYDAASGGQRRGSGEVLPHHAAPALAYGVLRHRHLAPSTHCRCSTLSS